VVVTEFGTGRVLGVGDGTVEVLAADGDGSVLALHPVSP
jgi:hypothetical protein